MQNLQTWAVGLVFVGAVGSGALAWRRVAAQERALRALQAELDGKAASADIEAEGAWRPGLEELGQKLAELGSRVEGLEREPRRPLPSVEPAPVPAPAPEPPRDAGRAGQRERAEFAELLDALLRPDQQLSGANEDVERFWELARGTSVVDDLLADLEAQVDRDPGDVALRMQLAGVYVAKLYTVTQGPEQGLWGGKAEDQWRQVTELDPDHWEAHFTLGNNFAYYPDFLDKTGEAIAHLERAREIQERAAPADGDPRTYLFLGRLYRREAKLDDARRVLEAGLERHPDDEALRKALAELPD